VRVGAGVGVGTCISTLQRR